MEKSLNFNKKRSKPSKTYSYPHLHTLSQNNNSSKSNRCSPRVRTNTLPNIVYNNTVTTTPSPPPGFDSANENVNTSPIVSYQFSAAIEPPGIHRQSQQQYIYPAYQLFDNSNNNQYFYQPKINEEEERKENENEGIPSREELFQMWNNFEISNN